MKSTLKPAPKDTLVRLAEEQAQQERSDPEFNDAIPQGPAIDPEAQDFRDQLQVTDGLSSLGLVQGIDAELKEQQRQTEADTLEVLEALRGLDAGETVNWRITRKGTGDPQLDGFLDTWPSALLTLERIRDKMGGGTYYLKGFRNGRYWVHKTVEIAGIPKLYKKDEAGNVSTSATSGQSFDVSAFLAQQASRDAQLRREAEERETRTRQEREEREERERSRTERMLALILPVVGTIGSALTTAFAGNRGSQMADIAALMTAMKGPDPITVLTQLKALERSGGDSTMQKVLPMLIDMAGEKARGGDTGWLDVVKELAKSAGPTVGALIEAGMQRASYSPGAGAPGAVPSGHTLSSVPALPPPPLPVAPQPVIVIPESIPRRERRRHSVSGGLPVESRDLSNVALGGSATTVGASSPPSDFPGASNMNFLQMASLAPHLPWLRGMLDRFYVAACRQKDPELYAALFLEELPEGISAQVVGSLLGSPDWYAHMAQLDAKLQDQTVYPWFDALRNHILRSVNQELAGDPSAGAHSSDALQPPARVQVPASARPAASGEVERPSRLPNLDGK